MSSGYAVESYVGRFATTVLQLARQDCRISFAVRDGELYASVTAYDGDRSYSWSYLISVKELVAMTHGMVIEVAKMRATQCAKHLERKVDEARRVG